MFLAPLSDAFMNFTATVFPLQERIKHKLSIIFSLQVERKRAPSINGSEC